MCKDNPKSSAVGRTLSYLFDIGAVAIILVGLMIMFF